MDIIKIGVVAGVVGAVVSLLFGFATPEKQTLQGVPGVNILPSTVTPYSGGVYATSTLTNSTLLTEAIDTENVIDMTLTQGDGTLTFMSSSSFPGIPNPGDVRTIYVRNATTTAGIDLTVAMGTGITLKRAASSTAMVIGDTDGDNTFVIDFVRKADNDINAYLKKLED